MSFSTSWTASARNLSLNFFGHNTNTWEIATLLLDGLVILLFGGAPLLAYLRALEHKPNPEHGLYTTVRGCQTILTARVDPEVTDPGLLKKHSTIRSFGVPESGFTYPAVRTFFRSHPHADKLPTEPRPLPLLVFIHGLGGSAAQFSALLTSLANLGPCLSIDLPGCGRSALLPTDWQAYTTDSLTRLWAKVIEEHVDFENNQGIILIGHSMGSCIAALLASSHGASRSKLQDSVLGVIALCPKSGPLTKGQQKAARDLVHLPRLVVNLLRKWDRRGGVNSQSVRRIVGRKAGYDLKKLQLRYNIQSRTVTTLRMLSGMLPGSSRKAHAQTIPNTDFWTGIEVPVLLIGGESDTLTPALEVGTIAKALEESWKQEASIQRADEASLVKGYPAKPSSSEASQDRPTATIKKPLRRLKTRILPAPASHALIYDPDTYRTVSGLIETFLADYIDTRLSPGWQLQHLSTEGKWEVKNLAKWRSISAVSEPLAHTFRAMKTMREVDDHHCPKEFCETWKGKIYAVIDISHESPVYDPNGLVDGGIKYHKFPTVSKLPPTEEEVYGFNNLVDKLKEEATPQGEGDESPLIAVHCHYGFNRTGFFLVCYLVERLKWRLQDALEEFEHKRPPGIKHDYFVDTLFARYCDGVKRALTT